MTALHDPDGRRLPIKLDSTSNGEFMPVPLSPANRAAKRLAHEAASENAKRLGVTRKAHGTESGFYDLAPESALDEQLARAQTGAAKREFIFDVQGHFIDAGPAAKVYGISADQVKKIIARDRIAAEKIAYSGKPDPHFTTYGPKTRREFLAIGG